MQHPFRREQITFKHADPLTPYQRAQLEWDLRLGTARVQAKNWRLLAILTSLITILLAISLLVQLASKKDRLYIAEVTRDGKVVNVAPLVVKYQPTTAQINFFLTQFIELTRTIPLDPVLAKKNWLTAYNFLTRKSAHRLNDYFRQRNPVALLGKKTISVHIVDINSISPSTIHVDWEEITTSNEGKEEHRTNYSGIFTIMLRQPTSQKEILNNPLGFYIVDFDISAKIATTP